ncbi:MAG: S-layer homology domain-containing protein [Anaerotignum faecicola]
MGKNFINKLLPLALTAAMIVPSVPAMAAPSDIAGHWAESVITQWQSKGLIQGYEDGTFKPGNTITRAEFVTLMNNAKGFWSEGSINFSDVKNGSWFYSAVARAVAAGYVKGYSDGSFKPNNTITRAEAAMMIANTAKLSANEAGAYRFTDIGSIPAWARGSVGAVVAAGYMTGYPDGSFDANASISRAEAVSSLNRMLGGTAYQPTQPTTPTTDTTKTTSDDVVIEDKGTTLKNQTVDGNVTIAKSVGNGDVTLRNVTIKGDLIVKGGGSNTVTLEDVDVRGKVRLLKEGVHLHLAGDTDIRKLLIDLAARITQSSSYKDEIDEIILAGDGDLNKTTRIDVPAKQLRIENQADLILGGDVEKLIVDEDAKGAEIEIKKGTTVNELNTDAKIKLTGKGRIDLLDVSASGVTYDKNLDVRKKDTSNGATAPKENGSTSAGGSSSTASKEITGAAPIEDVKVPYGTSGVEALTLLPKTIKLNVKGGTTVDAATTWTWDESVSFDPTNTTAKHTANGTFTVPPGYTYSGSTAVTVTVSVKELDKTGLEAALTAAKTQQSQFEKVTDATQATKTDKIYIVPDGTDASAITKDVKFVLKPNATAYDKLKTTITKAEAATAFASQAECNNLTAELTAATKAAKELADSAPKGTNTTTDAYILQQVKNELLNPDKGDYAYSSHMQPLKPGYAYWLYNGYYSVPNSSVGVSIEWSVSGSDKVTIRNTDESDKDSNGYHYGYGAKIADGTTTPMPVTFTATVKNSMTQKEIGTIDYTALIGAPISVSANQPSTVPQFTVISDGTSSSTGATKFTGVVPITLNGAEAITDVSDGCVTMDAQSTLSDSSKVSFSHISVDKVEKSDTGLNVTVTVTTGAIGGVWDENSPYPFKEGILPNISIDTSKLQLKENTLGWYLPTDNTLKLKDMTVEVLTPAFTKVEYADDPTTGNPTFTIQTQNMPENAKVEVALEKKDVGAGGIDNATIKKDATRGDDGKYSVTFDKSEFESGAEYYLWFRYGSPGSDWAYESVTNRPTYTPNSTTGGGSDSSESGSGNTTEGSQAGA